MRFVKFTMATDEEITGEVGVLPKIHRNWSNYMPSQPRGLGHDLLEHGTKETGAFDEECAALGGSLFVRDFGAHIQNPFYSIDKIMTMDLVSSIRDCSRGGDIRTAPKFKLEDYHEEQINSIMEGARPEAITSWVSEYGNDFDEDYSEENPFENDEKWARIVGWVKSGFARANRRFKGEQYTAFALFRSVEREFEKYWQSLLSHADTGIEFTIALDYESGCASMQYSDWL